MNREIKFRAWDGKKMVEPLSVFLPCDGMVNHENGGFTLMQFTGLKDNNGKEIYEGDIVEIMKYGKLFDKSAKVIFSKYGGFQFFDMPFQDVFRDDDYEVKVIGNVYENPSLINK